MSLSGEINYPKECGHTPREKRKIDRRRKSAQDMQKRALTKTERNNDREIISLVLEVLFYVAFLVLLLSTAMNNRDPMAFGYRTSVMPVINVNKSVEKIHNSTDFWKWMNVTLVPFLYPQQDWAGHANIVHPQMVSDFASYRVGPLRLRQHRVRAEPCTTDSHFNELHLRCAESWSLAYRETRHFQRKWKLSENQNKNVTGGHAWTEWEYRPWSSVGGTPLMGEIGTYPPGGYVIDIAGDILDVNRTLRRLKEDFWLDMRTRFLIVEMTLFCPHANLFAMVPVMFEFPQAHVFMGQPIMYPFRLFSYMGHYPVAHMICDALVYFVIVCFIVREIVKMSREKCKYFKKVWNILELANLVLSIAVVALYVGRHIVTSDIAKQVKQVDGQFYNFQTLAIWDELFGILAGFVCFLSTLQVLHLLRFNRRMSIFAATLKEASGDLSAFFVVFWLVFFAFVFFCYMMFGTVLVNYSSIPRSLETLVTVSLGSFDYKALSHVNRIFAPMFLFLYMMFMVFILINMLITILNDSFSVVREDISKQANEHELIEYILTSIRHCYPWRLLCGNKQQETESGLESPDSKNIYPASSPRMKGQPITSNGHSEVHKAIFKTSQIQMYDGLDIMELEDDAFSEWTPGTKYQKNSKGKKPANDNALCLDLSDSFMLTIDSLDFQRALNESQNQREQEVPDFTSRYNNNKSTKENREDDSRVPSVDK